MQLLYQPKLPSFIVLRKTFFEVPTHVINAKVWYECGGRGGGGGGGRGAGELSNHIFISLMTRIRGNKFRRKIVG